MAEEERLSLWDYAVAVYAVKGVKERLLALQNRYHLDVGAVLWCLYCGRYGYAFEAGEVQALLDDAGPVALHVVRPLRAVRLFLSAPRVGIPRAELDALRQEVLKLELKGEELVLRRLGELTEERSRPQPVLDDMRDRAGRLFTLAREAMDRPTMIADEEGPLSPMVLFTEVCRRAEEDGP